MTKVLSVTIVATILSAVLYRLGGLGEDGTKRYPFMPKWLFNTKVRDIGVCVACALWMLMCVEIKKWYLHIPSFLCMFAFMTTYWDKIFRKDNFYAHGFMIGLAYMCYGLWLWAFVRALVLGISMGMLCKNTENDDIEELGRGGLIAITLPLLLL